MKTSSVAVLLVLGLSVGCSVGIRGDIKIPADVAVLSPADTIPKSISAFSGTWSGAWYGDKTGTYMADQVVVVEEITSPTSARLTYAGVGRWGHLNGQPWVYRLNGTFADNSLQFTLPTGVATTLRMNPNGTLDATGTSSAGTWRGTFTRSTK